ncbi:DNA polymerase IV [Halocella sp. SP3-1]|uniref:DNA polymerase IV n=1 Tax=Halocella sp. SP3-1 TaxID=2382161 RepID=UPI000F7550E7|nr:DNA polymerase IV [Halocella sp. SP3-1]AZO95082.1 DNA polymerase IV [Halocella sp. SP3-1]
MVLEIMHIDMDAFFAAAEQLDNPELKGKPVIVGGTKLSKRGVVSTASYEARRYGVHSAMSIVEARKLCPDGIFLPGRRQRYAELSERVFAIFAKYTPLIEKLSIDEAFLDLTGCHRLFGTSVQIGKAIRQEIKEKIGLTASVGLAPNKFLAKLASEVDKPDGFYIIKEDEIDDFLLDLPVGKIWGIGEKTADILLGRGIKTVGQLRQLSINLLSSLFGKAGERLYYLSRGIDRRSVEVNNELKSISYEETFQNDLSDKHRLYARLAVMSSKIARRLRMYSLQGNTVSIKVRYGDFRTYTRRLTMAVPTSTDDTIYSTAKRLLNKEGLLNKPIRLLGVGISNFSTGDKKQLSLFSDRIKEEKLSKTIDGIKDRYGDNIIKKARNLE